MRHALGRFPQPETFSWHLKPMKLTVSGNKGLAQGINQIRIRQVIENTVFRTFKRVDASDEYIKNAAEILLVAVIRLLIS